GGQGRQAFIAQDAHLVLQVGAALRRQCDIVGHVSLIHKSRILTQIVDRVYPMPRPCCNHGRSPDKRSGTACPLFRRRENVLDPAPCPGADGNRAARQLWRRSGGRLTWSKVDSVSVYWGVV